MARTRPDGEPSCCAECQSWLGGEWGSNGSVPFEIHRMLVHVVIANEPLKDRHRVLGRFAKLLDPSVALWRAFQRKMSFILISAMATLQGNHRHIVIEALVS